METQGIHANALHLTFHSDVLHRRLSQDTTQTELQKLQSRFRDGDFASWAEGLRADILQGVVTHGNVYLRSCHPR